MIGKIYKELAAALQKVDGVRHVDLWNRNVEFLEEDTAFDMPAVFVEFGLVEWRETSGSVVTFTGRGTINLHIVSEWNGSAAVGSEDMDRMLSVFDLATEIQKVVSGINSSHWSRFRLQSSATNHDHEDVIDNVEVYSFSIERRLDQ